MELSKTRDMLNQGSGLFSLGEYAAARECFEKATVEDPSCTEAYIDIAQTYIMEDKYDKARENLKSAILINKKEAAAYFHLANVEMLDGNRDLAREHYAKALNYGFDSTEIYRNLAADAEELGNYSEALSYYDKIIAKDKMNAYAKIRKTNIFIAMDKYPEALKSSENLMETSPDLPVSYQLKFAILCDMGRFDDAEKVLDRAVEMFPDDGRFDFDRATIYGAKGENDKAIKILDEMEITEYNESAVLVKKAKLLLSDLKIDEAIEVLEPLYAKTQDAEAAYLLSTIFMAKKDYGKAKGYAQELIDKNEFDDYYYSAVYTKAAALVRSGDPESVSALREANKIFRAACARNPGYVQFYLYRAVCHKELNELNEAIELLDYIVSVAPQLAEAYYLRGMIFAELGQNEKAASDNEKAVMLKPEITDLLESK